MITNNKRLMGIMLSVTLLLLLPLIAMQFSTEVDWSVSDFAIAAILLFGTGLLCELVLRKIHKSSQRLIVCGVILGGLVLVWLELAVGIFGSPFAGS